MKRLFSIGLLFFTFFSFAAIAEISHDISEFVEGKDYLRVTPSSSIPAPSDSKITVVEFFSYGCPWCYELEPLLDDWVRRNTSQVNFSRVAVIFEKDWDYYAKAYYVAKALSIEDKMTPVLFNAIQEQNKTLGSDSAMTDFFISQGIDKKIANSAFESSPSLDAQIKQGLQLMQAYQVYVIPSIVVDGKYKTDLRMAADDDKLLQIVQFLVNKVKAEKHLA